MTEKNNDQNNSPPEGFERITPVRVSPGARAPQASPSMQKKTLPVAVVGVALILLLLLAAGVFLWLPQHNAPPVVAEKTPPPAAAPKPAPVAEPPNVDTLLSEREQAQNLAAQMKQKRQQLADKGVKQWAAQTYAENGALAVQAQAQFDGRDYTGAIENYKKAGTQADVLLKQGEQVLSDALARGAKAFADKDGAAAINAYNLALALAPNNAEATRGLRRAQSLDAVLEKMQAGRAHEQAGDLAAARDDYRAALKLDADFTAASDALNKVQAQLGANAFEKQMSRGLAALDRNDFATARTAFLAAKKLNSGDASAADGLTQANAGLQQQAISQHRQKALAAAADEHWQQAVDEYQAALKLDPGLAFAQAGEAQAQARLKLDQTLQYHLDHPQRLTDANVQASANKTLQQARAMGDAGPRLSGQIQKLTSLLAAMQTPVRVQLQSDDKTQVLVYHVGKLGKFISKTLELTPGEYTVVGRCPGYRDVRRTITVKTGQTQVGPVSIRCEEKI